MEQTCAKGISLLERLREGLGDLELIYKSVIQDGNYSPFDREENEELWSLWQKFRRSVEHGNEIQTVVVLQEIMDFIMVNLSPNTPQAQKS